MNFNLSFINNGYYVYGISKLYFTYAFSLENPISINVSISDIFDFNFNWQFIKI